MTHHYESHIFFYKKRGWFATDSRGCVDGRVVHVHLEMPHLLQMLVGYVFWLCSNAGGIRVLVVFLLE